ncbi:MAG: class I SAM-dependent methyltransferase [Defluviitaleaceae bacterium]|nr:class I SAM-dependent methyltransferase [Defluviitaleaceae bacterium]MCL2276156.1 class I SAM-dependent methyltransferase [Defluviitaleaceae bacterium]
MTIYETSQQYIDMRGIHFNGRVLDIGGGGEGIIGLLSGDNVVAIDTRKDELEEAPDCGLKIIMDACDLKFLDQAFAHVTCFFSLMYMDDEQVKKCLAEASRVLKGGGLLWIWDSTIPSGLTEDAFVTQLKIQICDERVVTTGYGVGYKRSQSIAWIQTLCENAGFVIEEANASGEVFFLRVKKGND